MSSRRSAWIDRRGQRGAEAAIDQVIERQIQAGEQVLHLADDLIEDSPYQARQSFSTASVEELAQGMRQAGFQGVLIVRPHSDLAKQRRGMVQLVYGHRRRLAWRQVCAERGESCLVPVVVRAVSDAELLTIGAQENLQRQDLDPVEEAQIVAWHERMFFEKNQAGIGAMLGKSSDWVSVRSRIHKLPDALKDRLRQRPRAIAQMLELAPLSTHDPARAVALADRVVHDNLTVTAIRMLIHDAMRLAQATQTDREEEHNRRVDATIVQNVTTDLLPPPLAAPVLEQSQQRLGTAKQPSERNTATEPRVTLGRAEWHDPLGEQFQFDASSTEADIPVSADLTLLQKAAAALSSVASRAEALPDGMLTQQAISQVEQALAVLRRAFNSRAHPVTVISTASPRDDV